MSYAAHYYEVLYDELQEYGLTMSQDFCDGLVDACGEDKLPNYGGASFCNKHVGPKELYWSYPVIGEGPDRSIAQSTFSCSTYSGR